MDSIFQALSNERRRGVVNVLSKSESESLDYEEISEQLVDQGYLNESDVDEFQVEMYHVHLPQLSDAGIVDYDEEMENISYTADDIVDELVELADRYDLE